MHKRIYVSLVLLMMVCGIFAQSSKLSVSTHLLLSEYADVTPKGKLNVPTKVKNGSHRVLTVVLLNEGAEVSDETFSSLGAEVVKRRGTVVFANVPVNRLEALAEVEGIRRVNAGGKLTKYNDQVRKYSMVDQVHEMTKENSLTADVPEKFRGKGVLVAVIDDEFDYGHPAFRDKDGKTRIKQILKCVPQPNGPSVPMLITPDQFDQALALSEVPVAVGHGTHLTATAAGSTAALADNDPAKQFYGMAPEADLLIYDGYNGEIPEVIFAITNAFDIADKEQRPLVINMSFGRTSALTDGCDEFTIEMAELVKNYDMRGKVICIAAGNDADVTPSAIFKCEREIVDGDWTLQKKVVCSPYPFPTMMPNIPNPVYPHTDNITFYSSDERPYAVSYDFVDFETRKTIASTPLLTPEYLQQLGIPKLVFDGHTKDGAYYMVDMNALSVLSPANRFYHESKMETVFFSTPVMIVVNIYTKETGMTINANVIKGTFATKQDNPDGLYAVPDNEGTINEFANSPNVICVGSYQSRKDFVNYAGETQCQYPTPVGSISPFSCYRTEKYGVPGPYIVAPGSHVLSAYHHNVKNQEGTGLSDQTVSTTTYNGVDYLWGHMSGTSMSSPAAAGIIALWLQADPTLTVADVRKILKETADYDEFCKAEPARVGVGKINALRGLQYILSTSGIKSVGIDKSSHATKRLDSRGNIVIEKNGQLYNVVGTRISQ